MIELFEAVKNGERYSNLVLADWYEEHGDPRSEIMRKYGIQLVKIPGKEYYMSIFTVTQKQFMDVMAYNPSYFTEKQTKLDTSNFPVETISWDDCNYFCNKISNSDLKVYLPSEEDWEYCCRAGTITEFHYGDSLSSYQANFNGNYPYNSIKGPYLERTCEVGSYESNNYGLYDMHGNVWEWTSSEDSLGTAILGGSWFSVGWNCRSADRSRDEPGFRNQYYGFRLAACSRRIKVGERSQYGGFRLSAVRL